MNLDRDREFRYFRKAKKLERLLRQFRKNTEEIDTGDDILREGNLNDMSPNLVVGIMRKLQGEMPGLKKKIRKAAKSLAKER